MTGTGKTTLAVHYAYEYGCYHNRPRSHGTPYSVVLWLDATEGLDQGYFALSKYDGVPLSDDQGGPSPEKLKNWLEHVVEKLLKGGERWLLIIDGCKDADFNRICECFPWPSNRGDVLITMYAKPDLNDDIYTLEVQPLSDEDGANLLADESGKDRKYKREIAIKIVRELERRNTNDMLTQVSDVIHRPSYIYGPTAFVLSIVMIMVDLFRVHHWHGISLIIRSIFLVSLCSLRAHTMA
jgi:hypothetical protein